MSQMSLLGVPRFPNLAVFCSSQPSLVHLLSSSIFPCVLVVVVHPAMVTFDQISLFSSVRSSNSHPDLLLVSTTTHFFRSHRSSTLDFHFLSHHSYIKAIMLYKGNHWTHLLAICIPYKNNRTSLQDSAR